jgi:GNAT superfamily N-acetyltransferase
VCTLEDYKINGFSDKALFDAFLLFENDQLAGFSLWYFRFSTWKGKRLYLEDLFVKSEFRSKGYGKILMEATIEEAKATNSKGLMWQVLDWNTPAIEFYKKYNARFDSEWINVHIDL